MGGRSYIGGGEACGDRWRDYSLYAILPQFIDISRRPLLCPCNCVVCANVFFALSLALLIQDETFCLETRFKLLTLGQRQ